VSLRSLPFVVIACLCGHARAEVQVQVDDAPFSAADLASALRVRVNAALAVHVVGAGDHVTVAIGDTTRDVELGGRTGPDAARLVALAVVDLALDDLAVVPKSAPPASALSVELLGSATVWTGVLAGATADLALAKGRWIAALDVSGTEHVSGTLGVAAAPVRACAGLRLDQLELRGGVAIVPTWVSDGTGDQVTLLGVTASARLRLMVTSKLGFVAAVGADAYGTQTVYHLGMSTIATPWVAPWLAAGMELVP
jgi:hypothetical protein